MEAIFFEVTRGKLKGKKLKVHQMCNDWVTAADADMGEHANRGQPINLASTYFNGIDRLKVLKLEEEGHLGQMFKIYYDIQRFTMTGTFKRKTI